MVRIGMLLVYCYRGNDISKSNRMSSMGMVQMALL